MARTARRRARIVTSVSCDAPRPRRCPGTDPRRPAGWDSTGRAGRVTRTPTAALSRQSVSSATTPATGNPRHGSITAAPTIRSRASTWTWPATSATSRRRWWRSGPPQASQFPSTVRFPTWSAPPAIRIPIAVRSGPSAPPVTRRRASQRSRAARSTMTVRSIPCAGGTPRWLAPNAMIPLRRRVSVRPSLRVARAMPTRMAAPRRSRAARRTAPPATPWRASLPRRSPWPSMGSRNIRSRGSTGTCSAHCVT